VTVVVNLVSFARPWRGSVPLGPSISGASGRWPLSRFLAGIADDTPVFHQDSVAISADASR
jgi:hypothetical protein